jgi:hypothetical protein
MVAKSARTMLAALGLLLGGCSSDTGDLELEPDEPCPIPNEEGCAQPRGTYETGYVERVGGTCGEIFTTRGVIDSIRFTQFQAPCSGDVEWSDDFCMASFEATCPEDDIGSGFYNEQVSNTVYSMDALSRTGVLELQIFEADGMVHCASIYDLESRNVSCEK